jgi:L-alanine-DL-glutamate epimerase-like enolase superfamily enzyme
VAIAVSVRTTIRLYAADLHYPRELQVHTAASGLVASLSSRYLEIDRSDEFHGAGEIRANISYLSHIPEDAVDSAIIGLCRYLPWAAAPEDILASAQRVNGSVPHVATAAVENALIDGMARRDSIPVAEYLGGAWSEGIETNQCLFWSPDETFDRLTDRFLNEGFRQLKVRIGIGAFEHDLARLQRLRERAGPSISIAVDANGAWNAREAIERLGALESLGLSYVEQPTTAGDWPAFRKALASTSIPLMVDEGLASETDVEEICAIGDRALAHLKIVKLGGPTQVVSAMRRLRDAGVGVMIGQMNEGALATAVTAHCVMALKPRYAELYGCYGLLDEVTPDVSYSGGQIHTPPGPGLGTTFDPARCRLVFSECFA